MQINAVTIDQIEKSSAIEVTNAMRNGDYSILESLGFHSLKKEMQLVGVACRTILRTAERRAKRKKHADYNKQLRKEISRIMDWGAPTEVVSSFPHTNSGLVFGFNHPSLGEIIRLIGLCTSEYPDRNYLFPVNIAWYEELEAVATRMEAFGLYIVPIITPATREKMSRILKKNGDEELVRKMKLIDQLAIQFNSEYLKTCGRFAENGDIILVAPSATRQATVFRSEQDYIGKEKIEPQTMTYIALGLIKEKKLESCLFLPIAIIPPTGANRRLNLFRTYRIVPASWIMPELVRKRVKKRNFEHYFLRMIADELCDENQARLVMPLL